MSPVFSNFGRAPVHFSGHAKQRIVQRFKLFMSKYELTNPVVFLRNDFATATINMASHMSPGKVNMRDSRYGKNSFIAKSKHIAYFGNYYEDTGVIVIKSLIHIRDLGHWNKRKSK